MKIGIVLCARSGSKRLPMKHLIPLESGETPIEILCKRIQHFVTSSDTQVCIATTTETQDNIFENLRSKNGIQVFRGNPSNIPKRQLEAAKFYQYDVIVSVDGDDILTSPEAINKIIERYTGDPERENKTFYTSGLPLGMNVSCYSVKLLESCLAKNHQDKIETGWGRIFAGVEKSEVVLKAPSFPEEETRFTLDYSEDLDFFKTIFDHYSEEIYTASTDDLIKFVTENSVYKKNSMVCAKYWENFFSEKKKEENQ